MSAEQIDQTVEIRKSVMSTQVSSTDFKASAEFEVPRFADPRGSDSLCDDDEEDAVSSSIPALSSAVPGDPAQSTPTTNQTMASQGHIRSPPASKFAGNLSSSGYSPHYNAWHVDPAIVYASNSYSNYSFSPDRSSRGQGRIPYGYRSTGPALYNTQTSVMSSVQVIPRSLKDHISQNMSRKGVWPGYHQNRSRKGTSHSPKHFVSYQNESIFVPNTFDGTHYRQVVQGGYAPPFPEGSSESTTISAPETSTPASPVLSSSIEKSTMALTPEVLAKLEAGQPIPAAVPSLFAGPSLEEALEQSLYNPNQTTNVYIRGLPPDTTDEKLSEICERFGEISSSKAIVDMNTSLCKGFGFACYREEAGATLCIAGLIHCGYQVSFAKESFSTRLKNLQDPRSTNLYLSNLPMHMNEKDLEDLFQPYKVISNRVLRDSNNISRGVGFARLADRESAEAIIAKFDNTSLNTESECVPLQVRFADSPNQKRLKGQTQRRRQWRAREYNLLTGYLDEVQSNPIHKPMDHANYMSENPLPSFSWEAMYRGTCDFTAYCGDAVSYPYETPIVTSLSKDPHQGPTVNELAHTLDQSLKL